MNIIKDQNICTLPIDFTYEYANMKNLTPKSKDLLIWCSIYRRIRTNDHYWHIHTHEEPNTLK